MARKEVPVQKGKINANPMTMKQMTHAERVTERRDELALLKRGQTLDLKTPKR